MLRLLDRARCARGLQYQLSLLHVGTGTLISKATGHISMEIERVVISNSTRRPASYPPMTLSFTDAVVLNVLTIAWFYALSFHSVRQEVSVLMGTSTITHPPSVERASNPAPSLLL